MCRSLSEVPKGLRPIRTTSGHVGSAASEDGDQQVKGFVARLKWARQQALRQTGNQHATQPTPARVRGLPSLPSSMTRIAISTDLHCGKSECLLLHQHLPSAVSCVVKLKSRAMEQTS